MSLAHRLSWGNAYHLYSQPGAGIVEETGGPGAFMGWPAHAHRQRPVSGAVGERVSTATAEILRYVADSDCTQ
jgi:hypothetical protein